MISKRVGHTFDKYLTGILSLPVLRSVSPSTLTVVGMLLGCAAAVLIARGSIFKGGVLLLVSGVFDIFDGAAARAHDCISHFGAFLDSVCDRCSDLTVASGFIIYYADRDQAALLYIACLAAIGTALVPYARARAECFIAQCNIGIAERPERILIIVAGCLTGLVGPALVAVVVLTVITVLQRVRWTYCQTKSADRSHKETLL